MSGMLGAKRFASVKDDYKFCESFIVLNAVSWLIFQRAAASGQRKGCYFYS